MISAMSKRGTPAGATIRIMLATKLQALVYWCRECKGNGQRLVVDSQSFTNEVLIGRSTGKTGTTRRKQGPPDLLLPKEKFDPLTSQRDKLVRKSYKPALITAQRTQRHCPIIRHSEEGVLDHWHTIQVHQAWKLTIL
jgi:hypothetical protein